jgi:hypothetical protein
MAYFSKTYSLKEMIHHIYGEKSGEDHTDRPNMMLKELNLYIDNLAGQLKDRIEITPQQLKKWEAFKSNLLQGISYYKALFQNSPSFRKDQSNILKQLSQYEVELLKLQPL